MLGYVGEPALSGLFEPLLDRLLPAKEAALTAHGHAPAVGESVTADGCTFRVEALSGSRIETVRIARTSP